MARFFEKRKIKVGLPPGSFIHTSNLKNSPEAISFIGYNENTFREETISKISEAVSHKDDDSVMWINVDGTDNPDILKEVEKVFSIHPLVLEDINHANQRPKFEDHQEYIYIVLRMLTYNEEEKEVFSEQISFVLGPDYVLSFQECKGDVFDMVRERIREAKGRIRKMGADYLAYALIDAIIDNYFIVLEKIGDRIEKLEDIIMEDGDQTVPGQIHRFKRDMIYLRKQVWPLRELISFWQRSESNLLATKTDVFIKDVYDHVVQIIDTIELYRDTLSGMHDVYLSSVSNKMNEVMKVLTIFAAIFIPLTFIAGIYGMNFEYIPELQYRYGYFVVWGIMITLGVGMLAIFKSKDWI